MADRLSRLLGQPVKIIPIATRKRFRHVSAEFDYTRRREHVTTKNAGLNSSE